jgi:hypothetical protein
MVFSRYDYDFRFFFQLTSINHTFRVLLSWLISNDSLRGKNLYWYKWIRVYFMCKIHSLMAFDLYQYNLFLFLLNRVTSVSLGKYWIKCCSSSIEINSVWKFLIESAISIGLRLINANIMPKNKDKLNVIFCFLILW